MKLSVVVVSHNTSTLLQRCLTALTKATEGLEAEILVIDNGYEDEVLSSVTAMLPSIRIISLDDADNDAKAFNHGIHLANGEFVLLVKPDIIVQQEAIKKALNFIDQHTNAGGVGVRILDIDGNYLPKSKKVLPSAWVTFFKLTGVLKQFPKSRLRDNFSAHHEEEFDTTETDVLGDNFMLLRRSVLETVGLFDERFKAFGSNIDLSYRMRLAGFKNFYYPKTYVIDALANRNFPLNWRYVKGFYSAMLIFVVKYFFSLPAIHVKPVQQLLPAYELKG